MSSRQEEAQAAIHRPKGGKAPSGAIVPETDTEEVGYAAGGLRNEKGNMANIIVPTKIKDKNPKSTQLVDNPDCIAMKRIINEQQPARSREVRVKPKPRESMTAYYIKMSTKGELYDPWGMYTEGQNHKYARHAGDSAWKYHRVKELCFKYYLNYLRSRNRAYLLNAEREVRNV